MDGVSPVPVGSDLVEGGLGRPRVLTRHAGCPVAAGKLPGGSGVAAEDQASEPGPSAVSVSTDGVSSAGAWVAPSVAVVVSLPASVLAVSVVAVSVLAVSVLAVSVPASVLAVSVPAVSVPAVSVPAVSVPVSTGAWAA